MVTQTLFWDSAVGWKPRSWFARKWRSTDAVQWTTSSGNTETPTHSAASPSGKMDWRDVETCVSQSPGETRQAKR